MPSAKQPITTPAPKYGPTALYGSCERDDCSANARTTCANCDGHFCRSHAEHETHAEHPANAEN